MNSGQRKIVHSSVAPFYIIYLRLLTLSVGLAVGEATGSSEGSWVGIFVGCVHKESKEKLSLDQDVFVNVYTLRELYI